VGRLLAIGGAEDRLEDRVILRRFLSISGGPLANILVLTAASGNPEASWKGYQPVFEALGAQRCTHLDLRTPKDADSAEAVARILQADGIFMSGGDQRRLMTTLWETASARAMHQAFHNGGCCIAGTSAGAAALSRQMLAVGDTPALPYRDAVTLDIGLGLVHNAIVDQHFSERRRLGRLLSSLALRPDMLGVGIDEDTALLIERGQGVEVIGKGAVTLVDGRSMQNNLPDSSPDNPLELLNVVLHVLPAGKRYHLSDDSLAPLPENLKSALTLLTTPGPLRV
jgi:cyanophycinase